VVYARPLHEGRPLTFGVSGMLWRGSLVMFDRETQSLWSHVTGRAVAGPLAGAELKMLPALHTTWALWRAIHPDTLVLEKRGPAPAQPHRFEDTHVLGVIQGGEAVALPFGELERQPLAHLTLAGRPLLVVYIEPAATAVAFWREVEGRVLTFERLAPHGAGWQMVDRETGSRWNAVTGEGLGGPLAGSDLRAVPATQAYLSSWRALYPRGALWRAEHTSSDLLDGRWMKHQGARSADREPLDFPWLRGGVGLSANPSLGFRFEVSYRVPLQVRL